MRRTRRRKWVLGLALAAVACRLALALQHSSAPRASGAAPEQTLRIAMASSDLPTTTGAPTQGLEGMRFAGYPVFEPLVMWDLRVTDHPPGVIPWLASAYEVDPGNHNRWIFHLRHDVRFQDGSVFDADAVVWNMARMFDKNAPQYEAASAASTKAKAPMVSSWEKIDPYTVAIYTKVPTSFFPEIVAGLLMVSPARYHAVGSSWRAFGKRPSGTGAFAITKVTPTSITMERNPTYWNSERRAKLQRIVLYSMSEGTTRIAALRAGDVDWIENPPTDAIPFLRRNGYTVSLSPMEHVWAYWLRIAPKSPFRDLKVRQAFNYAMDRQGLVSFLNGAAQPADGYWKKTDVRFGKPQNAYRYDPERARALLQAAGYPPGRLLKVKVLMSPGGSGQMTAQPMNELIQRSARRAGFDLSFDVVDYNQLLVLYASKKQMDARGIDAVNKGFSTADLTWLYYSFYPPNVIGFSDPGTVALMNEFRNDFDGDPAERQALLARIHERLVDLAPWSYVVHDMNPRAFAPKVKGYTPAQTWFTDLTTVYIDK